MTNQSNMTYYATAENMLGRSDGSMSVGWLEVRIIGRQFVGKDYPKFVLVETIDGSKRFTTNEEHMFIKTEPTK